LAGDDDSLREPTTSTGRDDADRFVLGEELGRGALGRVVRAFDRTRGHDVAIKLLGGARPNAIFRFKREFRALADTVHPHLVTLYTLNVLDGQWALSMELVEGARTFLEYVRPFRERLAEAASAREASSEGTLPTMPARAPAGDLPTASASEPSGATSANLRDARRRAIVAAEVDEATLAGAVRQLAEGLCALHARGMVHLDLKPSNVLVDETGRVVVCDFGLVSPQGERQRAFAGTPAYASPEQLGRRDLGPASDWYSVGVMLFEALTGYVPEKGPSDELFRADAPSPTPLRQSLERLCWRLLAIEPAQRAGGDDVFAAIGRDVARHGEPDDPAYIPFVGRRAETRALVACCERTRVEGAIAALVSGESGVGKSALAANVAEGLVARGALVLASRCYETETTPFKAIDGVIDAITAHLVSLPSGAAAAVIPPQVRSLVELFPVLRRVAAVEEALATSSTDVGTQAAAEGFAQLLRNLAQARPVIVTIDDLQWSDADSAPLLRRVLSQSSGAGPFVIATHRPVRGNALVDELTRVASEGAGRVVSIELPPLSLHESRELASALTGEDFATGEGDALLAEAGGSPMFVQELTLVRAPESARQRGLDGLIEARLAALPRALRELLQAAALMVRPQPLSVLRRVVDITDEARALAQLRSQRFVRVVHSGNDELLEPYHDRIRETAARLLDPAEKQRMHRRLARAYESSADADDEALAHHWAQAGDPARAGGYALTAARRALDARAYRSAARHLAQALEALDLEPEQRLSCRQERARALLLAGAVVDAGEEFAAAAQDAARHRPDLEAELRCEQLVCLLRAGNLDAADRVARQAAALTGLRIPRARPMALAAVAWWRSRLAMRGRRLARVARAEELDTVALRKLDVGYGVASALGLTDTLPGFAVHTKNLCAALDAGEPSRAIRSLVTELAFLSALKGARASEERGEILATATELAGSHLPEFYRGLIAGWRGYSRFISLENLRGADEDLRAGIDAIRDRPAYAWEFDVFRIGWINSLMLAGEGARLAAALPPLLREARQNGNGYLYDNLRFQGGPYLWLMQDRLDMAESSLVDGPAPRRKPTLWHYFHTSCLFEADLYRGDHATAIDRMEAFLAAARGTSLARIPATRINIRYRAARAHLAGALAAAGSAASHWKRALRLADEIERDAPAIPGAARGYAATVRGLAGLGRGDADTAEAQLREALVALDATGLFLQSMPLRRRLADLVGGTEGAALRADVDAWSDRQGIGSPDRLLNWFAPGPA